MQGVSLSIVASTLFGILYYYTTLLAPLNGEEIFAWRMLLTVPFLLIFTAYNKDFYLVRTIWYRLIANPFLIFALLGSSFLIGVQMWLFMWAPLHNKALAVSLGYFILPLALILTGRLRYKEKLSSWQKLATLSAIIGIAYELMRVQSFPPETFIVIVGYPAYFTLRREFKIDNLGGLWFDLILLSPVTIFFIYKSNFDIELINQHFHLLWLLPLMGLISACAVISYIMASRLLKFSLFGLLSYVEPVLLFFVSLYIGENIKAEQWPTYIAIWIALVFLLIEGILQIKKRIN